VVLKVFSYPPLKNPNAVNSSPTKITKNTTAKVSQCLLWRNNRRLWTSYRTDSLITSVTAVKQLVLACCRHSDINQPRSAVFMCWTNSKNLRFFHPQLFLPGKAVFSTAFSFFKKFLRWWAKWHPFENHWPRVIYEVDDFFTGKKTGCHFQVVLSLTGFWNDDWLKKSETELMLWRSGLQVADKDFPMATLC